MTTNTDKLAAHMALTDDERTELLDWVSACQSQYHIDSTPGHRFGGLGSNLEENRLAVVDFVNGLLSARALEAIPAGRVQQAEPAAWLVCSVNSDGTLSLEHAAPWREAAHEHINDAITEHGIEGAASWVVRPAYLATPSQSAVQPT